MNVDIMHKIPDTFCPAKWDELYVSFEVNYAYSCCKGRPTKFTDNVIEIVDQQRMNMLNGVQDPSCDYCWAVEKHDGESLRHKYLKNFDTTKFTEYNSNPQPKSIQVTVGNECNFQCTYCNPKFSSKWEHDVRQQEYKVFSDQHFWGIDAKTPDVMNKNIEFLKTFDHIRVLDVIGGEPLFNKRTFELIDSIKSESLHMTTNLGCKTSVIDRLLERCARYEQVELCLSIDATKDIAEFTRYGLDFSEFDSNIKYLLKHRPTNLKLLVNSLMTCVTVRDFENFSQYMTQFLSEPNFEWRIGYCTNPKTQSMSSLPEQYREQILFAIDAMMMYNIVGLDTLRTVVETTPYNKLMHQQMKHFMQEFAKRKNIEIPINLD